MGSKNEYNCEVITFTHTSTIIFYDSFSKIVITERSSRKTPSDFWEIFRLFRRHRMWKSFTNLPWVIFVKLPRQCTIHNLKRRVQWRWRSNRMWKNISAAGDYMFKINCRNIRTRCEICSKLTIKTLERRQWPIFWILQFYRNYSED